MILTNMSMHSLKLYRFTLCSCATFAPRMYFMPCERCLKKKHRGCRGVAFILWDLYPKSGRHDIQKVLQILPPTKPIRLICIDGLTGTIFPGQAQT